MASAFWDEALAERYRLFRYEFPERTLAGCAVIVAGGTGGLGAATVALLVREGAHVIVGFRSNRERAEALQRAMQEQSGQTPRLVEGDIVKPDVRRDLLGAVERLGAPLAGAAIFPGDPARGAFETLNQQTMQASLEANYIGPALLARDLGRAMEQRGGSLVLLASMQAIAAFPSSLNYGAPKAALVHAARILAQQWPSVRVNVVAPGATVAGMGGMSVSAGKYDSYVQNRIISRFGRPEDVARAVRFFLEPDNYTTGQVLVVDGGLTLSRAR